MTRQTTKLSFIIIRLDSADADNLYPLQLNSHLNGYSFFGGHIDNAETPGDAALRELREETGNDELSKRWGIQLPGKIPDEEWRKARDELYEFKKPSEPVSRLPFFSIRAQRENQQAEKNAKVFFFRLTISQSQYPHLFASLVSLSQQTVIFNNQSEKKPLCRLFSVSELFEEAWANVDNPFLRLAIKLGMVKSLKEHLLAPPYIMHLPALETFLQTRLASLLEKSLNLAGGDSLDFRVVCPSEDEITLCMRSNHTLRATLEVRWTASNEILSLSFPYSAHGVFILHSDSSEDGRAGKWAWHPRLVGQPGLWLLRKYTAKRGKPQKTDYIRFIFASGRHLDYKLRAKKKRLTIPSSAILPRAYADTPCGNCNGQEEIHKIFPSWYFRVGLKDKKRFTEAMSEALGKIAERAISDGCKPLDEQDINWQRLYTYSAFLVDRLIEFFAHGFEKRQPETSASQFWSALCDSGRMMDQGRGLVATSDLIKRGWLHYFDPLNAIDALSRLTSCQRYNFPKDTIEQLPAIFRQNHPSYRGIICPVETPESKRVGITLHLARGIRTDVLGGFHPAAEKATDSDLGFGASLVPFYQHNDGPRSMMGAKNLKQAMPIQGRQTAAVRTGHERVVGRLTHSLRSLGMAPPCSDAAPGIDLLVAYMPWYGWNMEDAIVANKRLVDEGLMDWQSEEERTAYILPGYELAAPVFENTFEEAFKVLQYEDNGLRRPGRIELQRPLAFFSDPESGRTVPLLYEDEDAGELIAIRYAKPPASHLGGTLHWSIRRTFPLMVGDKLMGRYGNKGVISALLPADNLPRLPDDPRLPPELRGRAIDLILNPHGVISRMNLGQLLETGIGLLHHLNKKSGPYPADIGRAFTTVDTHLLREGFRQLNGENDEPLLDENGRMQLTLPDGAKTKVPVVVGFQHIVRLKHVAAKKAHVRGWPGLSNQSPYNSVTGQPVGGRRRKGGQRLGEMEIWALAALQADANLQKTLCDKSDPAFAGEKPLARGQTFQAIKDHLFAMGIELQQADNDKARLTWASKETIEHQGKVATKASTWTLGVEGEFLCPKKGCSSYPHKRIQASGISERSRVIRLTVRDVLRERGLRLPDHTDQVIPPPPLIRGKSLKGEIAIHLEPLGESFGRKRRKITFQYKRTKRTVQLSFKLGRDSFNAYMQYDAGERPRDQQTVPLHQVANFWLTCTKHLTSHLVCKTPRLIPAAIPGGLCDPDMFGKVSVNDWDPDAWGHIKLPLPIPYPRASKFAPGPLRFGKKDHPPPLELIPVLPLKYRYRGHTRVGTAIMPQPEQLTGLYQELLTLTGQNDTEVKFRKVVKKLFELLHGRLFGKHGLLRRDGLGRRVETSGRLVIVPDPTLEWDACGVPTEILITLLGPRIAEHPDILLSFARDEAADRLIEAIFGMELTEHELSEETERFVLSEEFWTTVPWPDEKLSQDHLHLAHRILERYLEEFPETTVLLNRQPSLHRYSIMGFRPVALPPEEGLVLKINPLVCKGFGADFDGDEMTIHLPWTKAEQAEAEAMKPTKKWNLFSWANDQPLANFDQDFVAGHYLLSLDDNARTLLQELLQENCELQVECEACRAFMVKETPWCKDHGEALLQHLCANHPDKVAAVVPEWMRLAFKSVTEHGLSFGFPELEDLQEVCRKETETILNGLTPSLDAKILSGLTGEIGKMVLKKLKLLAAKPFDQPGHGFAVLAVSGARGTKQTRQLIGARGFLAPGETGFATKAANFFIPESLVAGMTPSSSFMAAMNARSSMLDKKLGTGKAGALTRALVLAGWEWTVRSGDCGEADNGRRLLTGCQWRVNQTICTACYGSVKGYDMPPDCYPAGLIAAQSFGERGTQLSMQSFHTAEKQLSIDEIVSLLNGKDFHDERGKGKKDGYNWFVREEDAAEFVTRVRRENAYRNLDERHLLLIWLMIYQSEKKTITSVWEGNRSAISGLIGPGQWKFLLEAIRLGLEDDFSSPFARIMTGQSPVKNGNREESQ